MHLYDLEVSYRPLYLASARSIFATIISLLLQGNGYTIKPRLSWCSYLFMRKSESMHRISWVIALRPRVFRYGLKISQNKYSSISPLDSLVKSNSWIVDSYVGKHVCRNERVVFQSETDICIIQEKLENWAQDILWISSLQDVWVRSSVVIQAMFSMSFTLVTVRCYVSIGRLNSTIMDCAEQRRPTMCLISALSPFLLMDSQ